MPRYRQIQHNTLKKNEKNFYIVDACFLANKYLPLSVVSSNHERSRIKSCKEWWQKIEEQLKKHQAIVYIPDICIAETIKVFAKQYYTRTDNKGFKTHKQYQSRMHKFTKDIRISHKNLAAAKRHIRYHDISTSRDILISIERFNRIFNDNGYHKVSTVDLIIVSTAKYLMDFYNIPYDKIHILTLDKELKQGSNKVKEIPTAYDPSEQEASKYFK